MSDVTIMLMEGEGVVGWGVELYRDVLSTPRKGTRLLAFTFRTLAIISRMLASSQSLRKEELTSCLVA